MENKCYLITETIIEQLETSITNTKEVKFQLINNIKQHFYVPFRLLIEGIKLFFRKFNKFYVVLFVLFFILTFFFQDVWKGSNGYIIILIVMLAFIIATFEPPSTFLLPPKNSELIKNVVATLEGHKVSPEQLQCVKSNLYLFERAMRERIIFLRIIIALFWSYITYFLSEIKQIETANDNIPIAEGNQLQLLVITLIIFYILVESYAKVNRLIFTSAIISCNELEFMISKKTERIGDSPITRADT